MKTQIKKEHQQERTPTAATKNPANKRASAKTRNKMANDACFLWFHKKYLFEHHNSNKRHCSKSTRESTTTRVRAHFSESACIFSSHFHLCKDPHQTETFFNFKDVQSQCFS